MQKELSKSSHLVNDDLHKDFVSIISKTYRTVTPFMKLFWDEQQKYLNTSKQGIRYHPMIIRYCLGLVAKSPAAYEEIRFNEKTDSGFVVLPRQRRLRDYKNYIRPQRGFNHDIVNELSLKVKDFSEQERFITLLFDEMKIQKNLVWDK